MREPKKRKEKVGKALPLADSQGRKGGLVGSPPRGQPPRVSGQRDGVANDAGDGSVKRNEQGVLRQPEQLEPLLVRPGDPIRPRLSRPNVIQAESYEPKSGGFTLLRHRHSRAAKAIEDGKIKKAEICLPIEATTEIIAKMDNHRKWTKMVLESLEDFESVMNNPDWLVPDKAKQVEMIIGTMHARITNLKNTLE